MMPKFMFVGSYTHEGAKGLAKEGGAVNSAVFFFMLGPSEVVELGGILLEDESARDAKKAPNESIWLRMVVRRTLRSTRREGQIGEYGERIDNNDVA